MRFDWNQVRAFLVTAEEGTLSAAARALCLSQPTLGRQVAALEDSLGVTLFERVGRGLVLTEAGTALLSHVRSMGEAAQRISLTAAGQSDDVEGEVRISAADSLSVYILPDLITGLRAQAPGLTLDIIAENRISDLLRREADIAIRHVEPKEPELIGRRLKDGTGRLYAAKKWIAANGMPQNMADLAGADLVGMDRSDVMAAELSNRGVDWPGLRVPLRSANGAVAWELVKAGHGLGIMYDAVAARTPSIVAIPAFPTISFPIWLITHRELRTARRIRIVFDHLAAALSDLPGPHSMAMQANDGSRKGA